MAAHAETLDRVGNMTDIKTSRCVSPGIPRGVSINAKIRPFVLSPSKHSLSFIVALILCSLGILAGASLAAQSDSGTLEIRIKDHRDAIGDFSKFNIVIDKILVSPKPGLKIWKTGWNELPASGDTIDLTKYVEKASARVFRASIESGSFDAFHLKVKTIAGVLKKNHTSLSIKNTIGPVKLSFDVPPRGETVLIIDLTVLDMSDHPPRGYELAIQGYELFTNGKLIQKIPPG